VCIANKPQLTYLVLATPQSLEGVGAEGVLCPEGHKDLANVHTSDKTVGLAESTTHTGLEPISSSARQHLVDGKGGRGHGDGRIPFRQS
jgi:hypothetical protein